MNPLDKLQVIPKSGHEKLVLDSQPLDFAVIDFWRWSASDLLSNSTRGRFAEFIVATATNINLWQIRDEWSPYDLETPEGIKIEVKSAAYLQSWFQRKLSPISFSTKAAFVWDFTLNQYEREKRRSADVYVFCLLDCVDKTAVDPLNLDQWKFYILPTQKLNEYPRSQHSITLKSLEKLTKAVIYKDLGEAVVKKMIC